MERYELIVIGGGPGGYVAAIRGAQLGKRVAIIEKNRVGGTCLNRGCIPTKALMHTAEVYREITSAEELGIKVDSALVDFASMHARKAEVVEKLVSGVEGLIKANGIDYYQGTGKVIGPNTVLVTGAGDTEGDAVSGDTELESDHIILATGSRPAMPPIPGLDLPGVVTSDEILIGDGLETDSLIIIGGGVIGVEIASVYNALGTDVTIIEAMDRILPTLDKEISQNLNMILKKRGISINAGARVEAVEQTGNELTVNYTAKEQAKTASAKNVLVCIGRRPNTEGLFEESLFETKLPEELANDASTDAISAAKGTDDAGAEKIIISRGFVQADETGKTGIDSIYAIGDILLGGIQLAHAASAEAINAVDHIFEVECSDNSLAKNTNLVPSGIYTDPEIASVGITEAQAKEMGIPYTVGKALTGANGKTLIESGERGYVKLIFAGSEIPEDMKIMPGKLLGAQMVCKRATDMIGALTTAMCSDVTLDEMNKIIWSHPTFSEVIGEAVEDALDGAIHAMPKKRK